MPPTKFDVILIDPPFYSSSFSWDALTALPIPLLAGDPSFVFMWVGSGAGDGLERGREVLARWGYRRCEDVVWVKTNNKSNNGPGVRTLPGCGMHLMILFYSLSLRERLVMLLVVHLWSMEHDAVASLDRPSHFFTPHTNKAALSDGYPRNRPQVYGLLVRPLQHRCVLIFLLG